MKPEFFYKMGQPSIGDISANNIRSFKKYGISVAIGSKDTEINIFGLQLVTVRMKLHTMMMSPILLKTYVVPINWCE